MQVGCKLRVCCAELVSSRPDDPLEAARSALLRLHYNGCSPVHWAERLGRASVPYTIRMLREVRVCFASCCVIVHVTST